MSDRERIRRRRAEELRDELAENRTIGGGVSGRNEPVYVQNAEQFRALVSEEGVVLAEFYADWCGPCKMLDPIVADVTVETGATVAKVDADGHRALVTAVNTLSIVYEGAQIRDGTLRPVARDGSRRRS